MSGDLVYVIQVVHGAVKTVAMNNRSVLPENVRKEIFLNIGEIYTLHFDLLQELEMQLEQWCVYMTACVPYSHLKLLKFFIGTQIQLLLMSSLNEHAS